MLRKTIANGCVYSSLGAFICLSGCTLTPEAGMPNRLASHQRSDTISSPPLPLSYEENRKRLHAALQQASFILHGQGPNKEIHIPFKNTNGRIYFYASCSGKDILCMLDTGFNNIDWPRWLALGTKRLFIANKGHWAGGLHTHGEWMLLPSLHIGNYELNNLPTVAVDVPWPETMDPTGKAPMLIGNLIWSPVILTIDYATRELIVRQRSYDITRLPIRSGASLIEFKQDMGKIVLSGEISHVPTTFLLDTGADTWAFSPAYYKRFVKAANIRDRGERTTAYLGEAKGMLGGFPIEIKEADVAPLATHADMLVGISFLNRFRITIDYGRHKVLFEPETTQSRRK